MKTIPRTLFFSLIIAASFARLAPAAGPVKFFRQDDGLPGQTEGSLPAELNSAAQIWRTEIDPGHSTPILIGNKLFITSYQKDRHELAAVALNIDGTILWKQIAPTSQIEEVHQVGSPATPTSASDGDRLFVLFGSYGLLCYDLDGKKLWEHPLGPFMDEYGAGSSPILIGDKVIINQDHDKDSFLIAIDRMTGDTVWKTPRPAAVRSYSTPKPWVRHGISEVLVAGALTLTSYDVGTGRELWWVGGLARIVIPIPVTANDTIYMASWAPGGDAGSRLSMEPWSQAVAAWDKNRDGKLAREELAEGPVLSRFFRIDLDQSSSIDQNEWERHTEVFSRAQNGVMAIRPEGEGDLTDKAVLWRYDRGAPYVASPLLHNGILWMVKDGGIVTKLDAATGELLHQERLPGRGGYYASPVSADGKVYFASEQGVVSVVADEKDWRVIASHDFGEKIYASPVIQGDRIYVRTSQALYAFTGKK